MTIERAAQAFIDVEYNDPMCSEVKPKDIKEGIRAALEAIAEPTPEMIDAGIKKLSAHAYDEEQVELIWRAMHAELLKRPK